MPNEELMRRAKERMPTFDTIISLFDMSFVYISEEAANLSEHTPEEMIGKHISSFSGTDSRSDDFRKMITDSMKGRANIPIKTKSGKKIETTLDFIVIEVDNEPFLVTQSVKKTK